MPLMPFLPQICQMRLNPRHDFGAQPARPGAFGGECVQVDDDVHLAADQMAMRRAVVALAHFEPELVVSEALLGGHRMIVWK